MGTLGPITGVTSGRQKELCGGCPQERSWPLVGGTLYLLNKYVLMPTLCQDTGLGTGDSVVTDRQCLRSPGT